MKRPKLVTPITLAMTMAVSHSTASRERKPSMLHFLGTESKYHSVLNCDTGGYSKSSVQFGVVEANQFLFRKSSQLSWLQIPVFLRAIIKVLSCQPWQQIPVFVSVVSRALSLSRQQEAKVMGSVQRSWVQF